MKNILEVNHLHKNYGALTAVNKVSFKIEKGNVYGILGPNGSGKSTTLGMVLNVVNPTSGSYKWFDGSMSTHDALKKIGAIIERPNFYPSMNAVQNLTLVCKIKGVAYDRIDETLDLVGLLSRKHSPFKTYSLGMKQRLAIASALLNNPEILILDEPTNGLDPQGIRQIRDLIKHIAKSGTTILLASHLLDEVEKVCSHVIVLRQGNMLYQGRVDQMVQNHGSIFLSSENIAQLRSFLNEKSFVAELIEQDNLLEVKLSSPVTTAQINKEAFEKGIVLTELAFKKQSLEDQFLELTKN
ncbi:ABC transporter ATP-binding protein [Nonlabens sp. MIC269]|uniref:ABC transporter ATP-binding protein n=1 Tax=Nonlabens TaxID=363408 RepID=UPI0007207BBC|nr:MULTISPECIES: ATP-binding cassette domain-containing protein [Nonlabens]ALM20201.1 ABC transporter ATP-binding protein [Nonlabens sp. MIC269]ARN70755.1 ABC transporter ATP-binding protein [Nonlabens tegetincola]